MTHDVLIARIAFALDKIAIVQGLFLAGSHGRGSADVFSDVDLIALVDPGDQRRFVETWRDTLKTIAPVVFWTERGKGPILINAITEDWLRCDMIVVGIDGLTGRSQETVKVLLDRRGLYETLPSHLPPRVPNVERVRFLINEFIRVLGLLHVVVGRQELVTAAGGAGLLRDHLVNLLLEEVTLPDPGGALHLSRLLPAGQMEMLSRLPMPKALRLEVIAAHIAIAREFFPRARDLAARLQIEWPSQFEAATHQLLQRSFSTEIEVGW